MALAIPAMRTGAAHLWPPSPPISRTITIAIATAITLVVTVIGNGTSGALSPPINRTILVVATAMALAIPAMRTVAASGRPLRPPRG